MQKYYNKKRKLNKLKASLLLLMMVCFAGAAQAQNSVYMHTGSMTVSSNATISFYDSGGESHGPDYYWERWFQRNEDFTFTFTPAETGKKIKVTFNEFTAYLDNGGYNHAIGNTWSLRLNTAELSIYDGDAVNADNLITTYTGNMTGAFSVIANGPITFYFHSYGYREEGWQATVQCVDSYELQKPKISFEACSDAIILNANNKGAEIYYTTTENDPDPNDPLTGATLYEGPFNVSAGTYVNAMARLNNTNSAVAKKEFTANDVTPTPGEPTISRVDNTITMTPAAISEVINETYYVWYTTDGSEPTITNGQRYTRPFEWHTPGTVFKAVTRAESCSDKISAVVEHPFGNVKVPAPTITFPDGNATITCTMSDATIHYTTDGSTPTADSPTYSAPFPVTYGTTVKAIAIVSQAGFDDSDIATEVYVPEGGAGTDGTIVILDDREDHNLSYYQKASDLPEGYPTTYLSSPDPRNVKITYKGNGQLANGNAATGVKVGIGTGETENTFIYLKTLEKGTDGKYAYTTIPNPFYVRPKVGNTYYGFSHWKVTSITGGTIEGNPTTINGETEIKFNPTSSYSLNCTSMEIVLEAVWDVAEVSTSGTFSNDYGVERMFYVVSTSTNSTIPRVSKAVTYTSFYPNGTTDGTTAATLANRHTRRAGFSNALNADAKIEYMILTNNNSTLTGNTYNFTIGRGVTASANNNNSVVATNLYALNNTDVTKNIKFRVESGRYTNMYFCGNGYGTSLTTGTLTAIIGSDYDRAKKTNSNLKVVTDIAFGMDYSVGTSATIGTERFHCTVKSGDFDLGTYGQTTQFYLSSVDASNMYAKRSLIVEGGVFSDISGGFENNGTSVGDHLMVDIRIKGGTIKGVTYGAAQHAAAGGHRRLVITGGDFAGWIAGGANGTQTTGGKLSGDTYIYFGGKATCAGDGTTMGSGQATGGNIFGAGSGNSSASSNATVGEVNSSAIVIADNATVQQNVYGGGNYGYVVGTGSTNKSDIYILGGTIQGSVFGGSNMQKGNIVNILMKDGTIQNNIYGGSNTRGTISGLATINVEGGEVKNVYGGGYGANTSMDAGTVVSVSNGTINNNVYGGGELGTVTGNTNVTVSGGTMKNVFGAGKGGNTTAEVSGQTFVTVSGGTISESVYGGGENGDVVAGHTDPTITTEEVTIGFEDNSYSEYITTTGTYPWERSTTSPQAGSYCFRSTNYHQNSSESSFSMEYNFEVAQTISFYYKVSSENGYDYLNFYVDGTLINRWSGTVAWTRYTYNISAGSHTLTWTYSKDYYTNSGQDRAWVDNITFSKVTSIIPGEALLASTVSVSGGSITGDVFGGGRMGKTDGSTEVDIKSGTIRGNVFGGAYGSSNTVFVAGPHTVNIMGGRIFGNVYGGSRNANDALAFTGYSTTETATSSVVNISAGQVDEQVYAAGYFGQTFGSVYVFVGKNAILHAPHCAPSFGEENENMYKTGKLLLAYNVWAGSDFGTFSGGTFTAENVSGYSDIYVDGDGYDTETSDESAPSYMNIKGSLYGCGTSGDAGKQGKGIYVRNYGHAIENSSKEDFAEPFTSATRTFFSIQRADTLVIDNSHINFTGQARVNSLDATEKYAIYSFDKTVRMTSGSSIFLNAPVFQIIDFWSATVDDLYNGSAAVYTPIAYNGLGATGGPIDNKVRVNGGNYIEVYHDKMTYENGTVAAGYGMVNGFAHMMVAEKTSDNTCAYARPKECVPTPLSNSNLDNPTDGGWVSYNPDENTFSIGTYSNGAWNPKPNTGGTDQIPYENHTTVNRAGEQYFRIWRAGGMYSEREGVLNAYADGTQSFNYVDVTIKLPAWRSSSAYYKFETSGTGTNLNTTIDYGPDVMTYPTAIVSKTDDTQNWVHFVEASNQQLTGADATAQTQINQNPNVNFGLVTLAGSGMTLVSPVSSQGGLIVCPESDEYLASVGNNGTVNKFTCANNTVEPQVTFRLTYSNQISTNMTWDPMFVTLVQCDENGEITDIVKISLTINTYTTINNTFTTQTYAIMDGNHGNADTYTAKVILPTFDLYDYAAEHLSEFILTNVTFEPNGVDATEQGCWKPKGSSYDFTHFAMEIAAARNEDNSDGWNGTSTGTYDSHANLGTGIKLGETGARTPFAFDFTLTYNGNNNGVAFNEDEQHPALLGVLTFTIKFTNYKNGTGNDHSQNLTIKVQVIRRGVGKVFYLDGQNGSNSNSANYPNDAALTLSYIFNRCGYMPGDIIYIVNTVDVTKNLEWSGSAYNGVTIYRYPGGHPLMSEQKKDTNGNFLYIDSVTGEETTEPETNGVANEPIYITNPIVDNEDNEAFTGTLVAVGNKGNLTIQDITLDGHKSEHDSPVPTATGTDAGVTAASPMITIASGGTLILTTGTTLQNNNSTVNGGAVAVNDGGTLKMNHNATIENNVTSAQGGAVYMAGTMIVSDAVQLYGNSSGTTPNNVYLTAANKVIQIGTTDASDAFGPLTYTQQTNSNGAPLYWTNENHTATTTEVTNYPVMISARIGVTKTLYGNIDGYTQVVKVETTSEVDWLETPYNSQPNDVIFHDGRMYQLEKYTDRTYLYWIGTWVTVQYWNPEYESVDDPDYDPDDFEDHLDNIDTPEELAWLISYVNGLNDAEAHPNVVATITADIDMNASIWVPIGNTKTPFKGTINGNGHVISGIHSILVNDNSAMFGVTDGATIQDMVVVAEFNGNSINKGTFIGTMNGGTLANVEAAGVLVGKENTVNMGGLVGLAVGTTNAKPLIHSSFAVNTITAEKATTVVGGLVGSLGDVVIDENEVETHYYADLYNSYSNVTIGSDNLATTIGGLVGINNQGCTVENCYAVVGENTFPAFAATNNGAITICYADKANDYVKTSATTGATLKGHGLYGGVLDRKAIGYMYDDNKITLVEGQAANNSNVVTAISYAGGKIDKWPGMVSALNTWVGTKAGYAHWMRPTTSAINGDLPILAFAKDNCMAAAEYDEFDTPYSYLRYSASDEITTNSNNVSVQANNGLDNLLTLNAGHSASIFLYGNAINVTGGTGSNELFINEDAVLLQSGSNAINATVGVTFDNSDHGQNAYDYYGHKLEYDWHFMSTPLADAPMGITYDAATGNGGGVNIHAMENNYFPNNLPMTTPSTGVKWDFYTYYEPEYHWINLKRSGDNHWHQDNNDQIHYVSGQMVDGEPMGQDQNETIFVPGKGYMMAISKDSYMSNSGVLNNGNVTITLTNQEPQSLQYNKGWNLVGNPYQAYLNVETLGTIYGYDADMGVYAPYSPSASVNPAIPAQNIHPHQAFFYHAATDGATLTFTPTMATTTEDPNSYFRAERVNYPLVNLFAQNAAGNRDLAVVEFNRPELGGATKVGFMTNANFQIAAHLDGQNYGLLFTPENTEKVPVRFYTDEDGTFTLTWSTFNGDFTSLLLVDNMTGTITDMLRSDHYTFDAKTSDYASRFYLTYACTGVEEVNEGDGSFAFFDGSEWVVNGKGQLDIIDVTGRVLFSKRIANEQNRVNLNNVAPGVYMMRVSDGKDTMVQKIVVR